MVRFFHYANHTIPLRKGSRYSLDRFKLLCEGIVAQGITDSTDILPGPPARTEVIQLAHSERFITGVDRQLLDEAAMREMGFVLCPELAYRARCIVGAALGAADAALTTGFGAVLGGGAHHSHTTKGRGYCVYNDIAIVALWFLQQKLSPVLIFDCDVHQGDGTAEILSSVPECITVSIHGEKNFPFRKVAGWLDIGLPDGTRDEEYLAAVERGWNTAVSAHPPAAVVYIAGADPYEEDQLGRLSVSAKGLRDRDAFVYTNVKKLGIPVVTLLGGGYCSPIDKTVDRNLATFDVAKSVGLLECASPFTPASRRTA